MNLNDIRKKAKNIYKNSVIKGIGVDLTPIEKLIMDNHLKDLHIKRLKGKR